MTTRHTLTDGMFGAKTQEELKAKAEEFLRLKGVEGRGGLESSDGVSFETGVDPEMVDKLGLPFADAYENAKTIHEGKKGQK